MEDGSDQAQPTQYSFTIKDIQAQALNDQQRLQTYSQVDEFLKPKTETKPQYNFVLNQGNQLMTTTASQQLKQIMPTSQPNQYVLTTNSGMRTVTAQQQQQQPQTTSQKTIQMVQSQSKSQCIVMKDQNQQVYQLKLEPQMSTADGQTIYQLNPVHQTFQVSFVGGSFSSRYILIFPLVDGDVTTFEQSGRRLFNAVHDSDQFGG